MTTLQSAATHYRTTIAGILSIVGGSTTFAAMWLSVGMPPPEAWAALGTALTVGGGLIAAADGKATPPKAQ